MNFAQGSNFKTEDIDHALSFLEKKDIEVIDHSDLGDMDSEGKLAGYELTYKGAHALCRKYGSGETAKVLAFKDKKEEAINLFNEVKQQGIRQSHNDLGNVKVLVDGQVIIGACTDQYKLIPTYDNIMSFIDQNQNMRLKRFNYRNGVTYADFIDRGIDPVMVNSSMKDDSLFFGIRLKDGMDAQHKISLVEYLYRLLCTNGMIGVIHENGEAFTHKGQVQVDFEKAILKITDSFKRTGEMIQAVGNVKYDPVSIALTNEKLTKLFPMARSMDSYPSPMFNPERKNNKPDSFERKVEWIKEIPHTYGGEISRESLVRGFDSMYDFVNIATEEAHNLPQEDKTEVEKEAYMFCKRVAKNPDYYTKTLKAA